MNFRSIPSALSAMLIALPAATCAPATVEAQSYPSKALHFITPSAPGNVSDIVPRLLAPELASGLGQPVIVDNRPGASAIIAAEAAAKSPPDGYTLFLSTVGTQAINPLVFLRIPYDPIKDFIPIALVATNPLVLVINPHDTKVRSLRELVELARAKPGVLSYGSFGSGSTTNLAPKWLSKLAGIELVHIPYKGASAAAFNDLASGRLSMMFDTIGTVLPHVAAGQLLPLAVTGPARAPQLPAIPTVAESGYPGFDVQLWFGAYVPAMTPPQAVDRLTGEFIRVLAMGRVRERFAALGLEPGALSGERFAAFQLTEIEKWRGLAKDLEIKAE